MSSSTRGVNASGRNPGEINSISYLTIASTGNALDFGDLIYTSSEPGGCSNGTRGIIAGGGVPNYSNNINYITIATTGNGADFGDMIGTTRMSPSGCSNSVRGVLMGGGLSPDETYTNEIQYLEIATLGNTLDFGDLTAADFRGCALASSTRGVYHTGGTPNKILEYVQLMTTGNTVDFGDAVIYGRSGAAQSNGHGGL